MGAVAHRNCRVYHLLPREAVHMAVQRGRVADDLEALIQTAIMLAVHTWFVVIADGKNFVRVAVVFPSSVDFQLHAEVARPHAVENRQRLVIIAVDTTPPKLLVATLTIRIIFIAVVQITGIIIQKQPSAALAGRVRAVIAPLAERVIVRPCIGIIPDPGPAVGTDNRFFVKAVFAEISSRKQRQRIFWEFPSADAASMVVSHSRFPPDKKITAGRICIRRLHSNNMWLKSAIITQFSGEIREHHGKKQRRSFYHERL